MHQGCLVWTPTPPLLGRRTPPPGPARVCVCVLSWPGWAGRPPGRFGAPHLFLWPFLVPSLSAQPPSGWGCPACGCSFAFSLPLCAPLVSGVSCFPGLGALGFGVLCPPPRPSLVFLPFFLSPPSRVFFCFFMFFSCVFFFLSFSLFFFLPVPWCAGCAVLRLCVLGCGACWCVLLWALMCFGGGQCALALRRSVPPACASSFCVVACFVARAQ